MAIVINGSTGISATESSSVLGDGVVEAADLASGAAVSNIGYTPANQANVMGRNRIINGDMRIDQRNAGAAITLSGSGQYIVDRMKCRLDASSSSTGQQSSTVPVGFSNSVVVTIGTGAAPTSGQIGWFNQGIEGYNFSDFGFGSANAKSITLSFWIRSSVTGTFSGSLRNSAGNRSYVFEYTVNTANTWEQKSVTIAGDTSGTWLTTNGAGAFLSFNIGSGSTYLTTAGAWSAGNYFGSTGSTSLCATSGATWYITGVQLEVGSVATEFERRPYGTELALCQRYCYVQGTGYVLYGVGSYYSSSRLDFQTFFPVPMRTTPSLVVEAGTGYYIFYSNSVGDQLNSFSIGDSSTTCGSGTNVSEASGTGGYGGWLWGNNPAAKMTWSAEL